MDEESKMSKDIIKAMFQQGVSSVQRERGLDGMGVGVERERASFNLLTWFIPHS